MICEQWSFYDDAGNLVSQRRLVPDGEGWAVVEWKYVYDAWNRLVEVAIDPDGGGEDPAKVRARYGYNGLHWRVWRIADEDLDGSALPDAANLYYYDAMWRLLEEHARGDFGLDGTIGFDDYSRVLGYAGQGQPEGALSLQTVNNTID